MLTVLRRVDCGHAGEQCKLYNGDIDDIDDVDPEAGELRAGFDGRAVTCELDTLMPAYAATIHKAKARSTLQSSSRF
jgi:ATP-dependent exoDNAse (exonuclease V) alpha subunit